MLAFGCSDRPEGTNPLKYPITKADGQVDDYHGVKVADPYRWLENEDGPEAKEWVERQNQLSQPFLEGIPQREAIKTRLTGLWNYERFGVPLKRGGKYFYLRNDGLQDQSVLYVAGALDSAGRVLIDPNAFSTDATVALADYAVSPDGSHIAYAVSDGGTDWKIWRVRDVETGTDHSDELTDIKFSGVSWAADSKGFYYSRYPKGADGKGDDSKTISIFYHTLGDAQRDDELVYSIDDHPTRDPYGSVTDDGNYLIIMVFDGYESNGIYYLKLGDPEALVVRLLDDWNALHGFLGNDGAVFYFQTTLDAPRGRIIAVDTAQPGLQGLREAVPEEEHALQQASFVGGRLVAQYLQHAHSLVRVLKLDGQLEREVSLPGLGTAQGFGGRADDPETFYAYTDFGTPTEIYRYDVRTGESGLFRRPEVDIDTSQFETTQVFYESKDGTKIPMFITHRKGFERKGTAPTLLYGYGGFNVSLTPDFRASRAVWLEMGGVLAIPNLRGGGEYGEDWHKRGTKLEKQNVFDDFIAAAEWLIANDYTSPSKLAIQGRSNGGLLVGAAMTQRPDLFGAALPAVGVLDMLRYHTASANARQWSSDYGLSENEEEFEALYAYSPYHKVQQGVCYPPTLVTTADHDDRVVPWHSYKFGAALQKAQSCDNPILIRIETRAGHGAGKPTWMQIEDVADHWAFLVKELGVEIDSFKP